MSDPSVKTMSVPYSPAEKAKRIRRAAAALEKGVDGHVLIGERGFSEGEIAQARTMLRSMKAAKAARK